MPAYMVQMPRSRSSFTRRSWSVWLARSTGPLAAGEVADWAARDWVEGARGGRLSVAVVTDFALTPQSGFAVTPSPAPPRRTRHADFPHCAPQLRERLALAAARPSRGAYCRGGQDPRRRRAWRLPRSYDFVPGGHFPLHLHLCDIVRFSVLRLANPHSRA